MCRQTNLKNWRPILQLGTDYKVVSKAVVQQLMSRLADTIHPDQTYTVLGQTIFNSLYLVWDLLHLMCRDGQSFVLLSFNQEKGFETVDP